MVFNSILFFKMLNWFLDLLMSFDSQFKSADLINDGYVWENLSSNLSLYLAALRICDKRDVRWSQDVTQPRLTLCRSVSISHLFLCISLPLSVHFSNTFLLFPFFFVSLSLSPGGQFYSVDDFTQGNYLALLHVWLWILWASMVYCYPKYWIYPFKERMDITSPIHYMPHIPILCPLFLKTLG